MLVRNLIVFLITVLCFGCGGGGGGSDSSDNNSSLGGDRGIRILHGVIDLEPLRVQLVDGTLVTEAEFAKSFRYFKLPEGPQSVQIFRTGDGLNPLASTNLNVDSKGKYSYLVFGNRSGLGTGSRILVDGFNDDIPDGQVAIRVVHAAVGAADLNYRLNGGASSSVGFGRNSEYILATLSEASELSFVASRAVDSRLIVNQTLSLNSGRAYTLFVTGEVGLYTLVRVFED